jgi:CD36 family
VHKFHFHFVNQKTAIPLEVAARFQINILVEPIPKITMYEKVQKKFMPILWFEQHVKMSEEIASEVKMLLELPSMGQMMGVLFIALGIIQIVFLPIKTFITRQCCTKHRKVSSFDKNVKIDLLEVNSSPEVSPLIAEKPKNGITLIGGNKNVLKS